MNMYSPLQGDAPLHVSETSSAPRVLQNIREDADLPDAPAGTLTENEEERNDYSGGEDHRDQQAYSPITLRIITAENEWQPGGQQFSEHASNFYANLYSVQPHQSHENLRATPPLPDAPATRSAMAPEVATSTETAYESLFDAVKGNLFYTLTRRGNDSMPKTSVLNISTLQHMSLYELQLKIARYVEAMYRTSTFVSELDDLEPLSDLLRAYCTLNIILMIVWANSLILYRPRCAKFRFHEAVCAPRL